MSRATCPSNSKVCHCGHLMPSSRISHMTAPAGPLTCLQVCTSKIGILQSLHQLPFFHFPNQTPSVPSTYRLFNSMNSESETDSFLNAADVPVGAMPTACPHHAAAWFSFRGPLPTFPHSSPKQRLLSCCIPETSPPDFAILSFLQWSTPSSPFLPPLFSIYSKTFSVTSTNSLFIPFMKAVMSSTDTLSFGSGLMFITSLGASCNTMRKSKPLHFDPGRRAVMVWSGSARHPSNCSLRWCSEYLLSSGKSLWEK